MNFFKKNFKGLFKVLNYKIIPRYTPFDVRWQMFRYPVEWFEKIRKCVYEEIIDEYFKREDYNINRKNTIENLIKIECNNKKIAYALTFDVYINHRDHILKFKRLYKAREVFSLINTLYDDTFVSLKEQINDDPDLEAIDLHKGLNYLDRSIIKRLKNDMRQIIDGYYFLPVEDQIPDYEDDYDKI